MLDLATPRGAIIAAALRLAAERPWAQVMLADIAEAAGTTLLALKKSTSRRSPSCVVVSERETARFIDLNGTWWSRMNAASDSEKRASLKTKESELAAAKDAASRRRLEQVIRQRKGELEELATLDVVTPDLVFDGGLSLDLGGRRVELRDWGRANSPHDVTVYLPGRTNSLHGRHRGAVTAALQRRVAGRFRGSKCCEE